MPAPVMSQLENVSAILGEYMLKGWTLTDLHCSGCKTTPLMREPVAAAQREGRERVQFCALCDGRPEGRVIPPPAPVPSAARSAAPEPAASGAAQSSKKEEEEIAEPDPAESISNLLLRGYSLLGETCRTPACRAIPLVGYPRKPDGSKDGRKMCVSCGGRWVAEGQMGEGWSVGSGAGAGAGEGQGKGKAGEAERAGGAESPRSRKRRELYGIEADGSASVVSASAVEGKGKGKTVDAGEFEKHARQSEGKLVGQPAGAAVEDDDFEEEEEEEEEKPKASGPATKKSATAARSTVLPMPMPHVPHNPSVAPSPESPLGQALTTTSNSLSSTLQSLSASLERYATHPRATARQGEDAGRWFVDLKLHTEAIKDVMGVIAQVERAKRVGY